MVLVMRLYLGRLIFLGSGFLDRWFVANTVSLWLLMPSRTLDVVGDQFDILLFFVYFVNIFIYVCIFNITAAMAI